MILKIMSLTKPIIAICGPKRAGKDTIADRIISKHNYEKIKIAEPLKQVVKTMFGFTDDQVGETDEKDIIDPRWDITPRKALQFFGTEVMQYKILELLPTVGRKFWINALIAKMENKPCNYIISDLRFIHEYEELSKKGVFVIKVVRPSNNTSDTHTSEEEYKKIPEDLLIINDGSIEDMLIKLDDSLPVK